MTMPPECWPEMARQILNPHGQFEILGDARMANIETGVLKGVRHGVGLAAPLPLAHQARQPPQRVLVEAQRLAGFARRRFAAIGDDVGRHGRAQLAVALVDVLDGLLALLFRGQVEIDVRPFVAALAQKALEEQFHANRIDGRNFQRVADGGIGRAAASLHQDVVLLAVPNDVPDDQEVSGKARASQSAQARAPPASWRAPADSLLPGAVAPLHAFRNPLAQKTVHRLCFRHRIARKLVAQIA